jgi:hypothetical protein
MWQQFDSRANIPDLLQNGWSVINLSISSNRQNRNYGTLEIKNQGLFLTGVSQFSILTIAASTARLS